MAQAASCFVAQRRWGMAQAASWLDHLPLLDHPPALVQVQELGHLPAQVQLLAQLLELELHHRMDHLPAQVPLLAPPLDLELQRWLDRLPALVQVQELAPLAQAPPPAQVLDLAHPRLAANQRTPRLRFVWAPFANELEAQPRHISMQDAMPGMGHAHKDECGILSAA